MQSPQQPRTSLSTPPSRGPASILLVEDDPNDILLIQRAFRKANLLTRLEVVRDGEEAITYLSAFAAGVAPGEDSQPEDEPSTALGPRSPYPSAILLDLKLPRKSGLEVLAWLRQDAALKTLPVVVLTSSREQPDLRRAYELGANSYLIKPVAFDALLEMMRSIEHYWVTLNQQPAASD